MIKRTFSSVVPMFLTGLLFALFLVGYCFYGILWLYRFVRTKKMLPLFAAGAVFLFAVIAVLYYLSMPLERAGESVTIVVPRGCTVRAAADSLFNHEIITSRQALVVWLKVTGTDRKIRAGRYTFKKKQGVMTAARAFQFPVSLDKTITVPEGLTIEQTAARIAQVFPFDTAEIIRLCRDTAFMREIGADHRESLEGYLFPDTYRLLDMSSPRDIVRRMVDHFEEVYESIDTSVSQLTKSEIVILASIVEKEAALAAERPRIAGVFFNRLALRQPLGADPTVRYALRKFSGPLNFTDLNVVSPYNTRRYRGLPPGPICSPGRASLIAAMSPMRTNELYFVARWDGSGAHEFSVTNEEHSRKKLAIRHQNKKRIRLRGDSCGHFPGQ
jgi:UPF0755 protein